MEDIRARILALAKGNLPDHAGWVALIQDASEEDRLFSRNLARERAQARFGKQVFFRGIIEFTNHCKNDCYYCGIRRSNRELSRYRLTAARRATSSATARSFCRAGKTAGGPMRKSRRLSEESGQLTRTAPSRSRSEKDPDRRIRRFLTRAQTGTCFATRRRTARIMENSIRLRRRSRTGCDVFLT